MDSTTGGPGPFDAPPWVMGLADPAIGAVDDPELALTSMMSARERADGRIYSVHPTEARVRIWNREGRPAGSIGRKGEGPGEFNSPSDLGFFGDTLWVVDPWVGRVSFFDGEGEFLGSTRPPAPRGDPSDRLSPISRSRASVMPLRDGSFYTVPSTNPAEVEPGLVARSLHLRVDADGVILDTIWVQEHDPNDALRLEYGGKAFIAPQPFGGFPLARATPDGLWVVERRPELAVTRIGMRGDTVYRSVLAVAEEPVAPAQIDHVVADFTTGVRGYLLHPRLESWIRESLPVPEVSPQVDRVEVGPDGFVWLRRLPRDTTRVEWWVLDDRGEPAGRVVVPPTLQLLEVGGDHMLAQRTDELGVPYLVRHALGR